jgi:hypothetical protein
MTQVGIAVYKNNPFPESLLSLKFKMPCGEISEVDLQSPPVEDIPCPCGDPEHWLVKHFEDPNKIMGDK